MNYSGGQVFLSLRHTRGVWLFEHHMAHPREVQELMRLSSLSLVDKYSKSFRLTDSTLIERGPDLSAPADNETTKATGTDDAQGTDICLARSLAQKGGDSEAHVDCNGLSSSEDKERVSVDVQRKTLLLQGNGRGRIRTYVGVSQQI